ncbi:MAG: redoxin family protein [bacterium]|nr:redoxin family protein [bacterium]
MVKWHDAYKDKGLVIIDVNNGQIDKRKVVKKHVKDAKYKFPYAWDQDAKVNKQYGVKMYPVGVLIGRDGKVIWNGSPGDEQPDELEKKIQAALKAKPGRSAAAANKS